MTEQNKDATEFEESCDIVDRLREFNAIDIHDIMDGAVMEIVQLREAIEGIKEGAAIRIADLENSVLEWQREFDSCRLTISKLEAENANLKYALNSGASRRYHTND